MSLIFRIDYWGRIYPYNKEWDTELSRILDSTSPVTIEREDHYVVIIGGVHVWVENYPYGYGLPIHRLLAKMFLDIKNPQDYPVEDDMYGPSRYNTYRLKKFIEKSERSHITPSLKFNLN